MTTPTTEIKRTPAPDVAPTPAPEASTTPQAAPTADGPSWIRRGPHESTADYDARWLRDVHAGDVPQFTPRAAVTGILLGAFLSVSNLYVGLKAGWWLSVSITALVLSTAFWRSLVRIGISRRGMSILEQNCVQSTAATASVASSSVLVTAVPAYMMATGVALQPVWLVAWSFFVSMLGVALVIPFDGRLVRHERLAWPSSLAAAQTLRAMHDRGRAAAAQARWLFASASVGAAIRWAIGNTFAWWKLPAWPETVLGPGRMATYGIGFDASALYLAAGAMIGPRVASWMLVGSSAVWLVFAPWLVGSGRIDAPGWSDVMLSGALWCGAGIMIAAGMTSLVIDARVLLRGLSGLRVRRPVTDVLDGISLPASWAWTGVLFSSVGIVWIGAQVLGIPWWASTAGIAVSAVLASVSIRAMGETDVAPAGALGKVMQLGYGIAVPHGLATNLFGTTIVTSSAAIASEAAVNLRCGHLLGASPRRQWLALATGVLAGVVVSVFAFDVLVPNVDAVGTASMPAPAAQAWRAVASLMSAGLGAIDGVARLALGVGVVLGVLVAWGDRLGDRRPGWWPSAFGLGIGMLVGFPVTLSFFAGSIVAHVVGRRWARREGSDDRMVALASGAIAGDSLMGVLLALLIAFGWMAG